MNETTLSIGHTVYKYMVVHVYDAESKIDLMPQRIQVNSILVELLPKNTSVTYTCKIPYNYLVSYGDKTNRISFFSVGFPEISYYLTIATDKISDDMYKVEITVAKELDSNTYVDEAWFILFRE